MSTLLLRLAAPMQSWGSDSKFDVRQTGREPTKSGVIGLLAAALGIRRDDTEAIERLARLKFGVRADREGQYLHDFHMAHSAKTSYVTHRYYLCDAVFLCGLEGDQNTLEELQTALTHPAYPLFLGRRSCPPTLPLVLGIREAGLEETLRTEKRLTESRKNEKETPLRIVLDAEPDDAGAALVKDLPISFSPFRREFGYRKVREIILPAEHRNQQTEHDPFAELEAEDDPDQNGT